MPSCAQGLLAEAWLNPVSQVLTVASPLLEALLGGQECCRLSRWHFGFGLEPVERTPLLLGAQAQGCALCHGGLGPQASPLTPVPRRDLV